MVENLAEKIYECPLTVVVEYCLRTVGTTKTVRYIEFTVYHHHPHRADFFIWTRFENLATKRRKINDRVVPILVAKHNWNDVICLSRPKKVAEFAQCVAP